MLLFKHYGEGDFADLSNLYYTFIITDGLGFTGAIEKSQRCVVFYNKWLDDIEETIFVAFGDDNDPPQLLNRKRNYIIQKYSNSKNVLIRKLIKKVQSAKITSIN
ncbi:MAG TPA: hypothetical protein VNG53_07335 [Bacteroidia bacterium]|nr:hypothetical protein [Bacteroidia bacterium]